MSEERQIQKEKARIKRLYVAILLIGIALAIILVYPTPHTYSVTEPVYGYVTRTAKDLKRTLNTDGILGDGGGWGWSLYDLPDGTLYIVVDISSTKILHVEIEDKTGEILHYPAKDHYYHVYGEGPVLEVKVTNPLFVDDPGAGSAVVSGEIRIYHEYTYNSWEIVDYETSTWIEMKPWWMR